MAILTPITRLGKGVSEPIWIGKPAKDFSDKESKLMTEMNDFLLQVAPIEAVVQGIKEKIKTDSKSESVKKATMALMMLPEYQLC